MIHYKTTIVTTTYTSQTAKTKNKNVQENSNGFKSSFRPEIEFTAIVESGTNPKCLNFKKIVEIRITPSNHRVSKNMKLFFSTMKVEAMGKVVIQIAMGGWER